jgi:oxygen-dependent protoporphyrinogen oxidase
METLPKALASRLGDSLCSGTSVLAVRPVAANDKPGFEIDISRGERIETLSARAVIVATPTRTAAQILGGVSNHFGSVLAHIEYAPVVVVGAGYRHDQIQHDLNGFGFLVPRSEGLRVLGTVWNSSLFPGRAPQDMACFTSFAAGATDPGLFELSDDEITEIVRSEVARVLHITGKPVTTNIHRYARALPQYNLGHSKTITAIEELTAGAPGLFLAGNYLSGPSIGSCVEQANRTADGVRLYLESVGMVQPGPLAHV